jgi:hypothetical protein
MGCDMHMLRTLAKAWVLRLRPQEQKGGHSEELSNLLCAPDEGEEDGGAKGPRPAVVGPLYYVDEVVKEAYSTSAWLRCAFFKNPRDKNTRRS